ncbi:MAG: hypothetical protein M1829_005043 [Trizodia sp. TS-e1964]|nr:MAG: hypothetical protein M1829_005043 [Trizodia sp. TS-e1964]
MTSRRAPLSNIPNGANSPYRAVAAAASKRYQSHGSVQREIPYGQPPPAKKQMLDARQSVFRTPPPRQQSTVAVETKPPAKRTANACQTALNRKLAAARNPKAACDENLRLVKQWQDHYRRAFPTFVFYFESVPEDVHQQSSRQILSLGAGEEKFFSNSVTHVVTTRPIPSPAPDTASSAEVAPPTSSTKVDPESSNPPIHTINPLLLDRSSELATASTITKARSAIESASSYRAPALSRHEILHPAVDHEPRRQSGRNADILVKARDMGMKIWPLEKLQRMMSTMFEMDTSSHTQNVRNTRSYTASNNANNFHADRDPLTALIRAERLKRDFATASKELIRFKGNYLFIHDMDEKSRPIMVREYEKTANREDGSWPQFRLTKTGRCPFIEEPYPSKQDMERYKTEEQNISKAAVRREKPAVDNFAVENPVNLNGKRILGELQNDSHPTMQPTKLFEPPKVIPAKRGSHQYDVDIPETAFIGRVGTSKFYGGEPVASGVQPSNITSAIRSQAISSTAAAPGAKAGVSKEVIDLKRKVLEKSNVPAGIPSTYRMVNLAAAAKRDCMNVQSVRRKAPQNLSHIEEDAMSGDEKNVKRSQASRKTQKITKKSKVERKEPKQGWCENCLDKFEDFNVHVNTRKHRKFAVTASNWAELDDLLANLNRPLIKSRSDESRDLPPQPFQPNQHFA